MQNQGKNTQALRNWRHFSNGGYTAVDNRIFRDPTLSARAKGVYCQIRSAESNPDWKFTISGIAACVRESEYLVANAIKELERAGFLLRGQSRNSDGTFGGGDGNMWVTLDDPSLFKAAVKALAKDGYYVISKRVRKGTGEAKGKRARRSTSSQAKPAPRREPEPAQGAAAACSPVPENAHAERIRAAAEQDSLYETLRGMSLKPVAARAEAATRAAYDAALSRGVSGKEILQAYELYIETYEASNGSNLRYAKQLARWLADGDGLPHFLRQAKRASQEASPNRLIEEDARILRRYSSEQCSGILADADAAYAEMLDELDRARSDRSLDPRERDELTNRLWQRAQRYMNSKTKWLASYIRDKEHQLRQRASSPHIVPSAPVALAWG